MASQDVKYIVANMSTVIVVPVDGVDLKCEVEMKKIELKVEAKVKEIINKLKSTHEKFEDVDFGPTEKDEFGAVSFYGSALPAPAGSKYPAPETLKWERPLYDDNKFSEPGASKQGDDDADEEELAEDDFDDEFGFSAEEGPEVWCKHGRLFLDGSSSGDVIQGQLGDCWFLSALAVMGASESLLQTCFWKEDSFKEYGLYVLRFYKDCNVIYVIIDDRLPVRNKDGKLIFAGNKDPNELWVPLIEKAYAKLHGCYKALIGGYTHNGLADMTGFCPRLIVMREGFLGYSEKYQKDDIWKLLVQYKGWNSLMGCSIQSNPKDKQQVEADAGHGLHMGHAYSLLGIGEIDLNKASNNKATDSMPNMLRLVKLRNPWGRGEWEGPFGDRSDERELHSAEIERVFNTAERKQEHAVINFNDGTFFMTFDDWMKAYTSLFVAVNFPSTWTGKRTQGSWAGDQGGNRDMGTWISNPKIKFTLEKDPARPNEEYRQVFVGLYIKDSRLTLGGDYFKDPLYATPLAFDIVTAAELDPNAKANRTFIPFGRRAADNEEKVKQPPYNFGTTQVDVFLKVGVEYFIVPSLYKRNQPGTFFLNVFADVPNFHLDNSSVVNDANKAMVVGAKEDSKVALKMSVGQYYDKKEQLRERVVSEAQRLNLSAAQLEVKFSDCTEKLTLAAFKRRMMAMGFMLTDFPDDDLVVLDADNDGTISHKEFIDFFREGLRFNEVSTVAPPPEPPVDDLLYKAVDLAGELTVTVACARQLRQATTWFNSAEKALGADLAATTSAGAAGSAVDANVPAPVAKVDATSRKYIKYDPVAAAKLHAAAHKERAAALADALAPRPAKPASAAAKPPNFNDTVNLPLTLANLDAQNSGSLLSPLKSMNPRVVPRINDAGTVVTGMSINRKEIVQKAGMEAAVKLHSDPNLQKAELSRTKFLSALRGHKRNTEGDVARVEDTSVLRKKSSCNTRKVRRDLTQDIDTQYFLNYWPNGRPEVDELNPEVGVRAAAVFSSATTVNGPKSILTKGASVKLSRGQSFLAGSSPSVKLSNGQSIFQATGTASPTPGKQQQQLTAAALALPLSALSASTVESSTPVGPAGSTSRFKSVTSDLWDYLIDCVVTISISRPKSQSTDRHRAITSINSRVVSADRLAAFQPLRTPISAPSTRVAPAKPAVGHAATPKSTLRTPGYASVTTAQGKTKQQSAILDAKDKLLKLEKDRGNSFEEVYRRLIRMPVTSNAELEGDRESSSASGNSVAAKSHTYLRSLFERFDKNSNGFISKDEFKLAMADMNVEVSSEDCDIFFNRFKGERPDNIDWRDFISFFDSQLPGMTTVAATARPKSIVELLMSIKLALADATRSMTELKITTFEKFCNAQYKVRTGAAATNSDSSLALFSPAPSTATAAASISAAPNGFTLPDNAIFQSLSTSSSQVKTNVAILHQLGVTLSEEDMARVSRIFLCKTSVLMGFVRIPERDINLYEILDIADTEITRGLNQRTGLTSQGNQNAEQTSSIAKLWSGLAPNLNTTVSFEAIATYLTSMLLEANVFDEEVKHSPRKHDPLTMDIHRKGSIRGIDAHILCRIIADTLLYSSWNRDSTSSATSATGSGSAAVNTKEAASAAQSELKSALSFSGLDAYVRNNRINYIERKLRYLMQLESNYSGAEVCVLVHVYLSVAQDEFVILAHDPLSGDVYNFSQKEDLKALPMGEKLVKLFMTTPKQEAYINKKNPNSVYFYNPWETPAEDAVITDLVSRLRLVRSKTSSGSSKLILAEEPKFVSSLKTLLDHSTSLPFFSILNDLTLTFEVHDEKLVGQTSIRSFVFSHIRSCKSLCTFLTSVTSSLNVVLATYNGGIRETFKWTEMLSHLTNYRNPFFTVQLLPAFIEPEQYIYCPEEDNSAFTGDEDSDTLSKQKSKVDYDGAPHPSWDATFTFSFQPPQLTNCTVLSTEVAKLNIENKIKYAVIMVREGKRTEPGKKEKQKFKFLTIYDPRTATDYQCGVKPQCKLHQLLYPDKTGQFAPQMDLIPFMALVSEAAEEKKILVGPAITPRLELNVYNQNGRNQELLGSCQISISSVLSGSGIMDKQRVFLTYKQELEDGRSIEAAAGDVQFEMRFRGQMLINAEKQAELDRLANAGKKPVESVARVSSAVGAGAGADSSALKNKLKDASGQLEDLRSENDSLSLECKKLKENLTATTTSLEQLRGTGANAALSAELKAAQDEKAAIAAVKEKIEKEKAQLAEELAKLAEQSKKEIEALKAANALAMKQAQDAKVDAKAEEERKRTAEEYRKLQDDYEQMRLKFEASQLQAQLHRHGHGSTAALSKSFSATGFNGGDMTRIEDPSLAGTVRGILQIFNSRHPTGNAMDGLQRLLNSYAKPDGTIIPRDLITCLNDVMIDISMEQATKICREVGMSMKGFTLVSALMGYLELELQQLRGKHEAPAARTTGRSPSPSGGTAALPVLNKSASVPGLEGNVMSKVEEQSLEGTMQGILHIFAARHDRKNAGGNALDSLQRLLSSYAKPDGTVVPKDLVVALADLMIDINIEQATMIVHEAGVSSKGTVLVTYLMAYLNKDMRAMSPPRRRMSTLRVSGEFQPVVEVSHDDIHAGSETVKIMQPHRPTRPSSAQPRASLDDVGKLRSSQSSRQVTEAGLNATVGHAPRRPRAPETHDEPASAASGASSLTSTAPAGRVMMPKVAKVGSHEKGAPAAATAVATAVAAVEAVPAVSPRGSADPVGNKSAAVEIDWSIEPLPPQWERKLPKGTNKYVYINHATKETQWHHPGDTSKQNRRPKVKKPSSGNDDTLNSTLDLGASGGSVGSHAV